MSRLKVPADVPDPLDVDFSSDQIRFFQGTLWRIFSTTGPYPSAWNELRTFGPLPGQRFDPHPLPQGEHPGVGVLYASTTPVTAFAEVFQDTRIIDRVQNGRTLASFKPTRELILLDLTSNFPVRNNGAAAMQMDDKQHTQTWARAVHDQLGTKIDGMYHLSSITTEPIVTLFSRVELYPAFNSRPDDRAALSDASADVDVEIASDYLGYGVT